MSRKLEEKRDRRAAEEQRRAREKAGARRRNLITTGIAVVVLIGVVALIRNEQTAASGPVGVAASEAGCGDIETFDEVSRKHLDQGQEHGPYNSDPPTSGPHYATPADPGFYTSPLEPEQLVHNLEHGQIVIWYRPDAPQETIDQIEAVIEREPPQQELALLAAPYDGVEDSSFVLTAWTASQSCASVSQQIVDDFRARFQGRGPEALTPPFQG
jgi:Protein of unknown function (DUF3105)